MKKLDLSEFRKTIELIGIDKKNGKWGTLPILYSFTLIILIINCIFYIINNGDDLEKSVVGIEGIIIYVIEVIFISILLFDWKDIILLIKKVEEGLTLDGCENLLKETDLKYASDEEITSLMSIWYWGFISYTRFTAVLPLIVILYRLMKNGIGELSLSDTYNLIPVYFPKNYETLPVFIIFHSMQSFFFMYSAYLVCVVLVPAFSGMQLIKWNLKLLTLNIKEMDNFISNNEASLNREISDGSLYVKRPQPIQLGSNAMKSSLIYFIQHHIKIYRKVNDVTKGLQIAAFSVNTGFALLLCASIYKLVKVKDLGIAHELAMIFSLSSSLYCYGAMGEDILTEDENLRWAVYEINWRDRPKWFKNSIQIILTRMNRKIDIKPFGLVALNLQTFLKTMQAAYSYYNLLSNF